LSQLSQSQLAKALFPIGHLTKKEVRALASQHSLPTKDRKDSQGICFLGKIKFHDFVKYHLGTQPGPLVEFETGKKIGEHEGVWFYTIGQRQGIGLSGGPWYVVSKSIGDNTVFISRTYYAQDKQRVHVPVRQFNWISGQVPQTQSFMIKLRHGPALAAGTLAYNQTGEKPDNGLITLAAPDQGIAPGQFAAFYDQDVCLGSAVIDN
jgi:tRNA-specific 2-thiouridylase